MRIDPQLMALAGARSPLATVSNEKSGEAMDSFGEILSQAMNQVNNLQNQATDTSNSFAAGQIEDIHQVMIASEKADVALQFTIQIRNKLLDAYHEIMRMQV